MSTISFFSSPTEGIFLSESQLSIIFNVGCLYAFVCFLFGLLSLQSSEYQERAKQWQQYYGSPETAFQLNKQQQLLKQKQIAMAKGESSTQQQDQSRFLQGLDFLYYFFIRPTVLIAIIFATIIIRNYQNTVISEVLAFGFSAAIVASWGKYPTKFIPSACATIGFVYGTLHLVMADQLPNF